MIIITIYKFKLHSYYCAFRLLHSFIRKYSKAHLFVRVPKRFFRKKESRVVYTALAGENADEVARFVERNEIQAKARILIDYTSEIKARIITAFFFLKAVYYYYCFT